MTNIQQKVNLFWSDIDHASHRLIKKMREDSIVKPTSIIMPVYRGGLVPGSMLAYEFDIKELICIDPKISYVMSHYSDLIVVDDVYDTGSTFAKLQNFYPHATYVALFSKIPYGCHYYGKLVDPDDWLVFPWAKNDEVNR